MLQTWHPVIWSRGGLARPRETWQILVSRDLARQKSQSFLFCLESVNTFPLLAVTPWSRETSRDLARPPKSPVETSRDHPKVSLYFSHSTFILPSIYPLNLTCTRAHHRPPRATNSQPQQAEHKPQARTTENSAANKPTTQANAAVVPGYSTSKYKSFVVSAHPSHGQGLRKKTQVRAPVAGRSA
jgi:hypothetical protein